jgi:hypothetical protein
VDGANVGSWLPLSPYFDPNWKDLADQWQAYYRVVHNVVTMRGLVTPITNALRNDLILTMPVGLRPVRVNPAFVQGHHFVTAYSLTADPSEVNKAIALRLEDNGELDIGNPVTAGQWVSLDSVSYRID